MKTVKITKEWLRENAKNIIGIELPGITGFVRWIVDDKLDFMFEEDDGSIHYRIFTFDYIIQYKDDINIILGEKYSFE